MGSFFSFGLFQKKNMRQEEEVNPCRSDNFSNFLSHSDVFFMSF